MASPGKKSMANGPPPASQQADVWRELHNTVAQLSETVELGIQALTPDQAGDKVVSATTKKRIHVKSLESLRVSRENIEVLQEHLKALQAASEQWQKTMMYASKSHEELMEQLESTNRDLQTTSDRLRTVEAQHLTVTRELEAQRRENQNLETAQRALKAALQQKEEDLETAHFAQEELKGRLEQASEDVAAARASQAAAEQERDLAAASLGGARAEADKANAAAQRHSEAVAKLTADNLVFVMNLKKAEADLAEALAEKSQYKLAAERQRGPWFDEVRASVEERVRHSMSRAETLEAEVEKLKQQHAAQLQEVEHQKADLEDFVGQLRRKEESLESQVAQARADKAEAEVRAQAAHAARVLAEHNLEELSMRNRVLQDDMKAMRQECTERWVTEQAALSKVQGLQDTITSLERSQDELRAQCAGLQQAVEAHRDINKQLMLKKEEVEWQLMAAKAKMPAFPSVPPLEPKLAITTALTHTADTPTAASQQSPSPGGPARSGTAHTHNTRSLSITPPAVIASISSPTASTSSRMMEDVAVPKRTAKDFFGSPTAPVALPHFAPPKPVTVSTAAATPTRAAPASPTIAAATAPTTVAPPPTKLTPQEMGQVIAAAASSSNATATATVTLNDVVSSGIVKEVKETITVSDTKTETKAAATAVTVAGADVRSESVAAAARAAAAAAATNGGPHAQAAAPPAKPGPVHSAFEAASHEPLPAEPRAHTGRDTAAALATTLPMVHGMTPLGPLQHAPNMIAQAARHPISPSSHTSSPRDIPPRPTTKPDMSVASPTTQQLSSTPHYVASSQGIVPLASPNAPADMTKQASMPPKARRTSAVLLEKSEVHTQPPPPPAQDGFNSDAFLIQKAGVRKGVTSPPPKHPLFGAPATVPAPVPATRAEAAAPVAPAAPATAGYGAELEGLEHAASLCMGIAAAPVGPRVVASALPSAFLSAHKDFDHDSSGGRTPTSGRRSPELPTNAHTNSSPIGREGPGPTAAQILMSSLPVYHPAMHPALLVPGTVHVEAPRIATDREPSLGGAPPAPRRISATSVTTTPPPKASRPQ